MPDYQLKTIKGYDLYEVSSAFQKCIRRGILEDAMYWAVELFDSNYYKYAWKRMLIISVEDVGLATPHANMIIKNLYDTFYLLKENKSLGWQLPFFQAVFYLTICKKSRSVDWLYIWAEHTHYIEGIRKEIPDFALDKHTQKGKLKGKGINDFINEGSLINNIADFMQKFDKEYKDKVTEILSSPNRSKKYPNKVEYAKKYNSKFLNNDDEPPTEQKNIFN